MIYSPTNPKLKRHPWPYFVGLVLISTTAYISLLAWHVLNNRLELFISLALLIIGSLLWLIRESNLIRLILMSLAAFGGMRLLIWRIVFTLNFSTTLNSLCSLALLCGELYAFLIFILVAVQNLALERDEIAEDPFDPTYCPSVDVFICTYNESTDIVRRTISGAMHIDYPDKKVYLLDDGRRDSMLQLATDLGCNYITRPDNKFAKAGNINHALPQTNGELILFLDADHIPCTTILTKATTHFKDPKVGIVQTCHRFMNPAPIQRNLRLEKILPGEQEMFFQLSMVGKNHWNAAIFAGTAGIVRRSVLNELGGMATETVIEDCEFSLKMHARGYKSIYRPDPQSISLSPDTLGAYFIQQNRWSRGQAQMLVLPSTNPFFCKGLSLPQRISYLSGNVHYLFGIPRMIYTLVPAIFLLFGISALRISYAKYFLFAAPFLVVYTLSQNYIFHNFRHSFWSDIYETVLAPYVGNWTTSTLIDPRSPKFHVTPKGIRSDHLCLDVRLVWPHVLLFLICGSACVIGLFKLLLLQDLYGIVVNLFWNAYNTIAIMCAILAGLERPQLRRGYRIARRLPVSVRSQGMEILNGWTEDVSEFGARIRFPHSSQAFVGREELLVSIELRNGDFLDIPASASRTEIKGSDLIVDLEFKETRLTANQLSELIALFYCDAQIWSVWIEPEDSIWRSFLSLIETPFRVMKDIVVSGELSRLSIFIPKELLDLAKRSNLPPAFVSHFEEIANDELSRLQADSGIIDQPVTHPN